MAAREACTLRRAGPGFAAPALRIRQQAYLQCRWLLSRHRGIGASAVELTADLGAGVMLMHRCVYQVQMLG